MRAIGVIPGKRELTLLDHPDPGIGSDGEVLVKSLDVGVCGTDREICSFVCSTPPEGDDYLVLGHESLGEVVDVAESDGPLKPGDFVVASVRRPCVESDCPTADKAYKTTVLSAFAGRGIKEAHGYMTEYYVRRSQIFIQGPDPGCAMWRLDRASYHCREGVDSGGRIQVLPLGEGADSSFSGKGSEPSCLGLGLSEFLERWL